MKSTKHYSNLTAFLAKNPDFGTFHVRRISHFFFRCTKPDRSVPKCANQAHCVKDTHFLNTNELKNARISQVSGELWPLEVSLPKSVLWTCSAKVEKVVEIEQISKWQTHT